MVKGHLVLSSTFRAKCNIRNASPGFNTVDATRIAKKGLIISGPNYNARYHAWQYQLGGKAEGRRFVLDVLLHLDDDFRESPRVTILSGNYRKYREAI